MVREISKIEASVIELDQFAKLIPNLDPTLTKNISEALDPVVLSTALADIARGHKLLEEIGLTGGYYIRKHRGKKYLILKGHADLRNMLKGTRYLADNPKLLAVGIGPIAATNAAKLNAAIGIALYSAVDVYDFFNGDIGISELLGNLTYNGISAVVSSTMGLLASAAVGAIVTSAAPAIGAGIVVGVAISTLANFLKEQYSITESISNEIGWHLEALERGLVEPDENVLDAGYEFGDLIRNPLPEAGDFYEESPSNSDHVLRRAQRSGYPEPDDGSYHELEREELNDRDPPDYPEPVVYDVPGGRD